MRADGSRMEDPLFGLDPQVTGRLAPSNFVALWAGEVFWDGRAGSQFIDPLSGEIAIREGGALENQVLETLANSSEMAKMGRTWSDLTDKLERERPLALARDFPPDIAGAIESSPSYPELFALAFGDAEITPIRIAFAIANYQRTLVADQTPWDRYQAGEPDALSQSAVYGWNSFQSLRCVNCHEPPIFSNNDFLNIGLRRIEYDLGRQAVTGEPEDAGEMKVPTLRNVALRKRFMHTGEFSGLGAAIGFYVSPTALKGRDEMPGAGAYTFSLGEIVQYDLLSFLETALTDPRVENETFPFDRPVLRTERTNDGNKIPSAPLRLHAIHDRGVLQLNWDPPQDEEDLVDYVLKRDGIVIAFLTGTSYMDTDVRSNSVVTYSLAARNAGTSTSPVTMLYIN
ncbi:MAG: cytochrome c peroxidase, partial [Pseudomonadota bacterium]|nr:cytochrome c peroxidase [Pseudomonadota bacterium]